MVCGVVWCVVLCGVRCGGGVVAVWCGGGVLWWCCVWCGGVVWCGIVWYCVVWCGVVVACYGSGVVTSIDFQRYHQLLLFVLTLAASGVFLLSKTLKVNCLK